MRQASTHNFTFSVGYTWLKYLYHCGKVRTLLGAQCANILQSYPNLRVQSLIISINLKLEDLIFSLLGSILRNAAHSQRHVYNCHSLVAYELISLYLSDKRRAS